ncbi:uncharacterized protein LOC128233974 isoform X2 [Mya arenaria]|uniref:uncharacterized protein LOC128233974 isoform X2 n=1 Tax=Mya arenaria TaxID=6604 RepID=UPI0022E25E36|nr:uncharacterized protein LOC128233974 isoform X2 [Mya arenaria]
MNARSETERTKLIDSAGLTGSNSQFANKLCTFKGTTEANARLVDGEDESEEWLKALNVDVDKWTDDDAPKLRQDEGAGCADKEDIRENDLTENRDNHLIVAPHNSTEDDVTNFNGGNEIVDLHPHNRDCPSPNRNEIVDLYPHNRDCPSPNLISASSVPINSLFMLHMVLVLYFIFGESTNDWSSCTKKDFIINACEAMKKKNVKKMIMKILEESVIKQKTEDIIGLDGIERIKQASSYVYDNFPMPKQQEEERQNIQKIPDEKKKEELLRNRSSHNLRNVLKCMRHVSVHYHSLDLKKLRKELGGGTYPDNVVRFFEDLFPGIFHYLLVVFKLAYPSKALLHDVLEY